MIKLSNEGELHIDRVGRGVVIAARRIQLRSPTLRRGGTPYLVLVGGGRSRLLCSLYSFGYLMTSMKGRERRTLLGLNSDLARAILAMHMDLKWGMRRASGAWLYAGWLRRVDGLEFVLAARRRNAFVLVGGLRAGNRGRGRSVKLRACRLTAEWWRETMKPQPWEGWKEYSERVRTTVAGWGFPKVLVDAAIGSA